MAAMKTWLLSLCVIIGFFLYNVECEHFEFNGGQDACILLDMDATFELSMGNQTADPFGINGANVTSASSLCGSDTTSALLSLSLFPSSELLRINFRRDTDRQTVSMSVVLMLDPKKHFDDAIDAPFELEDSDDLPIGVLNMSYKCASEEQIYFNQDPGYAMTMRITNLQVQAYNVENEQYSQALVCDQDLITTMPTTSPFPDTTTESDQTTEPSTSSPNPETTVMPETTTPMTTKGPETTTPNEGSSQTPKTTVPTTSPEPATTTPPEPETTSPPAPETTTPEPVPTTTPKIIPKYEIKDGDTVCIVFQGEIKLNINYERNNSQTATASITVPEDAKPTGDCALGGDNSTQEFKLTFFDDKWSFTVTIAKDEQLLRRRSLLALEEGETYSWKTVELKYVIDEERFEDPKEADIGQEKTVTKEEDGAFKASGQGSYKCSSGETLQLDDNVSMDFGNFQYRAFGQDNSGNFTNGDVSECPADTGDDDDDDDDTVAIVLGSVFGGLALILLVGIGVYCLKNKKRKDYEVM